METEPNDSQTVVCTLTTKDRAHRELEWTDLRELALTSEGIDGGVVSTFPADLEAQVKDLADREASCCGTWLNSTVTLIEGTVRLELSTTNPDGVALIRSMAGLDS